MAALLFIEFGHLALLAMEPRMSEEEAAAKLNALQNAHPANAHREADLLLCDYLDSIGHTKIAAAYRDLMRKHSPGG